MQRVLSIVAGCALCATPVHADLLSWDGLVAPLRAHVEADGRTRVELYVPPRLMKVTSAYAAQLSLQLVGGPTVTAVLPLVRIEEPFILFGEAATTLELQDGSYRAAITVIDVNGRAISETFEQVIFADDCGFSGQGSGDEVRLVSTPGRRWLREPTVESLHLQKAGGAVLRVRMLATPANVPLRMTVRRPDGSEMFHCVDSLRNGPDRLMTAIGGSPNWPEHVLIDFSLENESQQPVETRRLSVPVLRSLDEESGCTSSIEAFSWTERLVTFFALPLLLGYAVGSVVGRMRRRRRP